MSADTLEDAAMPRSPRAPLAHALGAAAALSLLGARAAVGQHDHAHMDHAHAGHEARPAAATAAERAELTRQAEAVRRATERYRDFENAKRDGYARFGGEAPLMGEHWYRKGVKEPPEGTPLDLEHPGTLQYAVIDGRRVLVGVAFSTRLRPGEPLPEGFAGPDDHWHQHDLVKAVSAGTEDRPVLRWLANRWIEGARKKGDDRSMLTMAHAWVWLDNPDGLFAMHHRVVPYLKAGLPASYAAGASEAAARGLDLATDGGCKRALEGELWMAHASRAQRRALFDACKAAARQVRSTLEAPSASAQAVNATAESAWEGVERARRATYTERQLERIGSVTEMMM